MAVEESLRRIAEVRDLLSSLLKLYPGDFDDRRLMQPWEKVYEADELLSDWQVELEAEQMASLFPRKVGVPVEASNQIGERGAS